jgi:hypothetical protein
MRQIGYVVTDLQEAMRSWAATCRIGPWFYFDRSAYQTFLFNGNRHDDIDITVGFANSGDIQIELIQQRCQTPSMYLEYLASNPQGGMQHWSSWPVDYQARYEAALRHGYQVAMEGTHARGPFCYFREEAMPGAVIEMSELTPGRETFFDMVREAAREWDGKDPIRRM